MSDLSTQIVSYAALGLSLLGMAVTAVNHRALRSRCCGREATISLDIDSTRATVILNDEKSRASDIHANP